jgi:hypothetical protein
MRAIFDPQQGEVTPSNGAPSLKRSTRVDDGRYGPRGSPNPASSLLDTRKATQHVRTRSRQRRALADFTLELLPRLSTDEWQADSACHGWRVQDVISHMAFFFNFIADPALDLPANPSGKAERLNDAAVRERADWSTTQVIDYYQAQSAAGLATLQTLQSAQMRDQPLELLDLGEYRMAQLSDAVAFDHLVHLTFDLLAPHGPLPHPTVDPAVAIDPAIDWMMSGVTQMCATSLLAVLDKPIGLTLTGATRRSFVIDRASDREEVLVTETGDLPGGAATSDAMDFLQWGTRRSAWRPVVEVGGDGALVARVLDAIDVI